MTQTAYRLHEATTVPSTDRLKAFIQTRLARREPPERIAAAVHAYFGIAIDGAQVIPYLKGEIALPTQTERRQDKESVQVPADEVKEPNFTRMADVETPDAAAPRRSPSPRIRIRSPTARRKKMPSHRRPDTDRTQKNPCKFRWIEWTRVRARGRAATGSRLWALW